MMFQAAAQRHSCMTGRSLGELNAPLAQYTSAALTFPGSLSSCEGRGDMSFGALRRGLSLHSPHLFRYEGENGRLEKMPKGTEDGVLRYLCSEEECEMGPAFIYALAKLLQAGQNVVSKMHWRCRLHLHMQV